MTVAGNTAYQNYASINTISQATANSYINNGIAKARQVSMNYGCSTGAVGNAAVERFKSVIEAAKNSANEKIEGIKVTKGVENLDEDNKNTVETIVNTPSSDAGGDVTEIIKKKYQYPYKKTGKLFYRPQEIEHASNNSDTSNAMTEKEWVEYITEYVDTGENELYTLLKNWGFSLTEEVFNIESEEGKLLFGGIKYKFYVTISLQTGSDTNFNTDISVLGNSIGSEVKTPEVTFKDGKYGISAEANIDYEKLGIGVTGIFREDEWTFKQTHQEGLYSTVDKSTIIFEPEDILLPSVAMTYEFEVNHLVKVAAAAASVASVYVPQTAPSLIAGLARLLQQLGEISVEFIH